MVRAMAVHRRSRESLLLFTRIVLAYRLKDGDLDGWCEEPWIRSLEEDALVVQAPQQLRYDPRFVAPHD